MSASTEPKKDRIHHKVMHHAKKPHGLVVIAMAVFVLAWGIWTFIIW